MRRPGTLERAHFLAAPMCAPHEPAPLRRETRVASQRRRMWACSPLLRRQRYASGKNGEGDSCRDHTPTMHRQAQTLPPLHLIAYHRVLAALVWLAFALGSLRRGKVPIGPGSQTIAVPSRGLSGPWQCPSPLVFGCPLGPDGTRVSCIAPAAAARSLRRLIARARTDAPRPTLSARVTISKDGWVMRPRYEPEMYGPVDASTAQA